MYKRERFMREESERTTLLKTVGRVQVKLQTGNREVTSFLVVVIDRLQ